MTLVEEEVSSQPRVWLEAATLALGVADLLPKVGERVAFFGCGTSLYIGQALATAREQAGHGESDAVAASELPLRRRYDLAIALSRSGTTTEVLAWSEAYPALEYRHGPISVAGPGTLVWALAELPPGLAEEIRDTGADLVEPSSDALVELVRVQRFAVSLALARGLDPDHPRHLSRSVVLDYDGQRP